MISKKYSKTGKSCRVTFKYTPENENAQSVSLLGDFNEWGKSGHKMVKRKNGYFSVSVQLDTEQDYEFRYFIDDNIWTNDDTADTFVKNTFGTENALLSL